MKMPLTQSLNTINKQHVKVKFMKGKLKSNASVKNEAFQCYFLQILKLVVV